MSVRGLARAVDFSPSLISQIEHGKANPSIAALYAIVSILEISLDELFSAEARPPLRPPQSQWRAPSEGPVLRKCHRLSLTLPTGVRWERLTASSDHGVEFVYSAYPVGGESTPADEPISHEGYEYGVILDGRCGVMVDGERYELASGDSIAFESRVPHRIWNLDREEPMLAIWVVVSRGNDPRVA